MNRTVYENMKEQAKNTEGPKSQNDTIVIGFKAPQNRMEIPCVYCGETHSHGIIDGYRVPHCSEHPKKKDYFIKLNYLDKLKLGVIDPDYDQLIEDYTHLLRAYKQSFVLHSDIKQILHQVEERPGAPIRFLNMVGTKWTLEVIKYLVEVDNDKLYHLKSLNDELSSLRKFRDEYTASDLTSLIDQIQILISLNPEENYVYFFESEGRFKIGRSANPYKRYSTIKTHSPFPVEFVFAFKAPKIVEKVLHEYFKDYRSHGEWFDSNSELIKLIQIVRRFGEEYTFC